MHLFAWFFDFRLSWPPARRRAGPASCSDVDCGRSGKTRRCFAGSQDPLCRTCTKSAALSSSVPASFRAPPAEVLAGAPARILTRANVATISAIAKLDTRHTPPASRLPRTTQSPASPATTSAPPSALSSLPRPFIPYFASSVPCSWDLWQSWLQLLAYPRKAD